MGEFTRRRFLTAAGALAATAATGACGGGGGKGGQSGALVWWDHQYQLEPAKKEIFKKFASSRGGMPVQYTYYNPSKMGQTLQLAKQSNRLPDIHSNAGLNLPAAALVAAGWAQPLNLSDAAKARVQNSLVEGIHMFDGKIYAFPIFSHQSYSAVTWFNTSLVEKAGLDPQAPPKTYDEFRAAARAVQSKAGPNVYGWIWNIGMPDRLTTQVNDMAQAAGFPGGGGMRYTTGEFAYHADEYVNLIEFLVSLQTDKLLAPGATNWIDDLARTRWAGGLAAYYIDGPWCPGVVVGKLPAFTKNLGVGPILVPDAGKAVATYHGPQPGDYWLSPGTKYATAANKLLSDYFTTPDYSVQVADTMSQPPRDIDAVDKSKAHPAYKKMIGWMRDTVFLAPDPVVGNPDIQKVQIETKPVRPTLGDIVQGAFTGNVKDVRAALKKLSDDSTKQLELAIAAAQKKGAHVAQSDYAFANWKPGADYPKEMYGKR